MIDPDDIAKVYRADGKQKLIVPQGSVLGPLLFLIFINEVVFKISPESSMSLFADDMALYRPIYSPDDYAALQEDISKLVNWINSVLLALQPSKCCAMLISRKRDDSSPPPTFTVDGTNLALVKSVTYLGVQITSDLSWSPHISNLCAKTRKLIGLLYRRFYKHADSATLLQLYKTFIRPHLEYAAIVWDPYLAKDIESLEKVQRFGLCMALKDWSLDHEQLLQQSSIQKLSDRRSQSRLCHLFKIFYELCDFPDAPLKCRQSPYNCRNFHHMQLVCPRAKTSQYLNSFFPKTINRWNSLPSNYFLSSSLSHFKHSLSV